MFTEPGGTMACRGVSLSGGAAVCPAMPLRGVPHGRRSTAPASGMSPEDWGISLVKCSAEPGRARLRRDASLLRGSRGSLAASDSDGGVKAAGRNTGSRPATMFNGNTPRKQGNARRYVQQQNTPGLFMSDYHALALFSGGLDSILAARLIMDQGLRVKCLHFISPFFGKPAQVRRWENVYGLDIDIIDVGEQYARLLGSGPAHGFGSVMNPCVDCKILMMRTARELLPKYGARFLVSGEVLGQRPMSQRRDTLNIIRRDADARDILLRPLCALHLDPTEAELSGLVDRGRLLGFSGRGRKDQLALAEQFGIREIPTPGGGCMLTEKENARRYWPVLENLGTPDAADFRLANLGRQFWLHDGDRHYWLSVGRNQADNERYAAQQRSGDMLFKLVNCPGPLALGRGLSGWPEEIIRQAAALTASYSPRARAAGESGHAVRVRITECAEHGENAQSREVEVFPSRAGGFAEPAWEDAHQKLLALRRQDRICGKG